MTRRRRKQSSAKSARPAAPGTPAVPAPSAPRIAQPPGVARPVAAPSPAPSAPGTTPAPPPSGLQVPRGVLAAVTALALAWFGLAAGHAARVLTPTPDEFVYVPAGLYHLRTGDLSFDPTNPPLLKMLVALPLVAMPLQLDLAPSARDNRTGWGPWIFGTRFQDLNRGQYLDAFFRARLVVVVLGLVLLLLVRSRARDALPEPAATIALLLLATLPPLLAHSAVATLDVGVSLAVFAGFFAASRMAVRKEPAWAAMAGAAFGLGMAIKGTTILFLPLAPLLVAAEWGDWSAKRRKRFVALGLVAVLSGWVAVLAAYGFDGFPLPAPLIEGIRFQLAAGSAGEFPAFLAGEWSARGWWYYYLAALALKVPLPFLVLLGVGLAVVAAEARRQRSVRPLAVLAPALLLLYVLSFHYAKDYGVRYLLPAFPFLAMVAAHGALRMLQGGRAAKAALAALLLWQAGDAVLASPDQLAWFNAFGGGPDRARRLLLDSNLDWGQDLGRAADWARQKGLAKPCLGYFGHVDPRVYGMDFQLPPPRPTVGTCVLSANFLAGYPYAITYAGERILGVRAGVWSWYDRLVPTARIGNSLYVFDVTQEDVDRLAGSAAPAAQP